MLKPMQKSLKRFSNKDFKSIHRAEKGPKDVIVDVIYSPGEIVGHMMLEQTEDQGQPLYFAYNLTEQKLIIPFDTAKGWTEWQTEEKIYRPLPKLPWRPLSTLTLSPVSVEELYREIRQYIYARVDFTKPIEYDLTTAWVMHTWRMENWNVTPYLFFYGPPASGKTWAMEVLSSISFRPLFSMMSPAALYYATQDWHPTLFMDESEIYMRGKDKSDIINYLNAGYRRGQVITRVEENSRTGQRQLKTFEVFGAKCLAGTREFLGTLQTRLIPFVMSRATREIETFIDQEIADDLRAKLFAYRLSALSANREPLIFQDFFQDFLSNVKDGRLRELFYPLIETVQTEKERALFVDCAVQMEMERTDEEASKFMTYLPPPLKVAYTSCMFIKLSTRHICLCHFLLGHILTRFG
jgi:hypothetical protein